MSAGLREERVAGSELFKGDFLHARRDQVRLPDGQLTQREYIIHPGAVMVVPLLQGADGTTQLVLERQFRYPVQQVIIEFPAGKLDPGESTLGCAQRELHEETGYTAREWARAGVLHPVVSYSTEFIEVWFARELQSVLGYARWENFTIAIGRAVESCKSQNINVDDHFREVTKMLNLGE